MELAIPTDHPDKTATSRQQDDANRDVILPFKPETGVNPALQDANHISNAARSRLKQAFRSAADAIYRYILVRVGHNTAVADDLLQQTCCVAAGHGRIPQDPADYQPWLFGIARNLVREHWRKSQREPQPLIDDDTDLVARMSEGPLPEDLLQRREIRDRVIAAITELSAEDQHLIFACYFQNRPQSEVAADTHTTRKSVETKLYRARQRLRDRLTQSSPVNDA